MVSFFSEALRTRNKDFEFTLSRTRSAKDVFLKGGHVTLINRDQRIRVIYDNRRVIIEPKGYKDFDMSINLFDSKPFLNIHECAQLRFISKFAFKTPYLKSTPVRSKFRKVYRSFLEIAVRNFLKGYVAEKPLFGLLGNEFKCYKDLISFIYGYNQSSEVKVSKQSISNLKHRRIIIRPVPNTRENIEFTRYIKNNLPYFDDVSFLKRF